MKCELENELGEWREHRKASLCADSVGSAMVS